MNSCPTNADLLEPTYAASLLHVQAPPLLSSYREESCKETTNKVFGITSEDYTAISRCDKPSPSPPRSPPHTRSPSPPHAPPFPPPLPPAPPCSQYLEIWVVHVALLRHDIASASKTLPPKVNFSCQSLCTVTMAPSGHTMILQTPTYIHDDIWRLWGYM